LLPPEEQEFSTESQPVAMPNRIRRRRLFAILNCRRPDYVASLALGPIFSRDFRLEEQLLLSAP
jgi:hypothetical protein